MENQSQDSAAVGNQSKDSGPLNATVDETSDIKGQVLSETENTGTETTTVGDPISDETEQEIKEATDEPQQSVELEQSGELEHSGDLEQSGEVEVDPAVIERLTHGVLEMFLPNLQKAKGSLNEVLHNQEVLIETIQQENSKFTESASMKELIHTMQEAKVYHGKLVNLKKEMNALMEKSTKLKRRAVKLQQQKQKELLTRADQQERELERERMLTAKVAKLPPKQQNT